MLQVPQPHRASFHRRLSPLGRLACLVMICGSLLSGSLRGDDVAAGWPMKGHDARRTGRANVKGPRRGTNVWRYVANDGITVNMEAAVSRDGVFFGTWGVIRRNGTDRAEWNKFDGRIYGVDRQRGRELWSPIMPAIVPYAYEYEGREPTPQDGPAGKGRHWNYFNGTVEGTPAIDPRDGTLYVGRGDGRLFAINPKTGRLKWTFETHDPARPDDPEGGGEVIGGPLLTPDRKIVIATWAAPHRPDPPQRVRNETNAVYCIDTDGAMLWRYPRTGTLESVFAAPCALSPDGTRVYAVTGLPDPKWPCALYALELKTGRLVWKLDLGAVGGHDLSIGIDGTIFVAGADAKVFGSKPAVLAVRDAGIRGRIVWGPIHVDGPRPPMHFASGLALYEERERVRDIYTTSTMLRNLNGKGGKLHRLEPATGDVTATWDPERADPPCSGMLTDVTLDVEGVLYVGVRGRWRSLGTPEVPGRMYCLRPQGSGFEVLWSFEVERQIDWASPAIGPEGGLYFGSSSEFSTLKQALPFAPDLDLPDADPVFYGIRD